MKQEFSSRYQAGLQAYLKHRTVTHLQMARGMGHQALAVGIQTLDLAKLHEQILLTKVLPDTPPGKRIAIIRHAGTYFAASILPIVKDRCSENESTAHWKSMVETLSQRTVELAASNLELSLEITLRKTAEAALKKSERHYSELLEQSERLQEQLRQLSRQILSAQEEERRRISRELHDVIAQTLTGINVRLAALNREAALNTKTLSRHIAVTQRLVEKSVDIVHRFARELRPAVLDDLGLIPALHSYMKAFTARTGVRTHLTASAGIELLDTKRRTVLYRVAQESITNVARHAKATRVEVIIRKLHSSALMEIKDNGKSFHVERVMRAKGGQHLGILGMRERVEMFGGTFSVESAQGHGTTVRVEIPIPNSHHALPENPHS